MSKGLIITAGVLVLGAGIFFAIKTYKTKQQQTGKNIPVISDLKSYVGGTGIVTVQHDGKTTFVRSNWSDAERTFGGYLVKFMQDAKGSVESVELRNSKGIAVNSIKA